MIESLNPIDVTVKITPDDIRMRTNLTTIKNIKFTKKISFLHNLGLCDPKTHNGFFQNETRIYLSEKPIKTTGIDRSFKI